jgi:hypothetical protein
MMKMVHSFTEVNAFILEASLDEVQQQKSSALNYNLCSPNMKKIKASTFCVHVHKQSKATILTF